MSAAPPAKLITKNVNIIGAGASGLYTCYKLLQLSNSGSHYANISLNINVWDKLPIPFGLVRNGVAPDHPEIKNCIETFKEMFENTENNNGKNKVKFIGNYNFDRIEEYQELLSKSDLLFLATGCETSRKYKLENDTDAPVLKAKDIVDWYNNYPYTGKEPNTAWKTPEFWRKIRHINVIGNGNVAFDICRIFAMSKNGKEDIEKTDINSDFVNTISAAPLQKINIIGRRDFSHAKFGTREFRELWALDKYGVHGAIKEKYLPKPQNGVALPRALAKRVQLAVKNMKKQEQNQEQKQEQNQEQKQEQNQEQKHQQNQEQNTNNDDSLKWELKFLSSPFKVDGKKRVLYSRENSIDAETLKLTPTESVEELENDLVILSIGTENSHSSALRDLVASNPDKIKSVGWLKNNGSGSIADTMLDTFPLAERALQEIDLRSNEQANEIGDMSFLRSRDHVTDWKDYKTIEAYEREAKQGKKCASAAEMLAVLHKTQ